MFTHQTHLRHLLHPNQYTSERQYRVELRHLFLPAWHPLATVADLPRPGDFLTFDLLEAPILLRNCDGELRAFLNVCPHRHSRLTDKPRGNSERLRCQYHGWEFDRNGAHWQDTGRLSVPLWDRENVPEAVSGRHLRGIAFINLSDTGVALRERAGTLWDVWSAGLAATTATSTWEQDFL